jgi:hypothetical protein
MLAATIMQKGPPNRASPAAAEADSRGVRKFMVMLRSPHGPALLAARP